MKDIAVTVTNEIPEIILWRLVDLSCGAMLLGLDEKGRGRFFDFIDDKKVKPALEAKKKKWPEVPFVENLAVGPLPKVLCLLGTDFQIAVWKAISEISWGKTMSYGELAKKIGRPSAARAVGTACGANPFPLFIPCHRVIAGNGGLGGFGGGLAKKKLLLEREGFKGL